MERDWVDVTVKWTRRHPFWTGVIVAAIILLILGAAGLDAAYGLSFLLGNITGIYLFCWGVKKLFRRVRGRD